MSKVFDYLDSIAETKRGKLIAQLIPIITCLILLAVFIALSWYFITAIINPNSVEPIHLRFYVVDVVVGFFLYFVTAIDYALIVGRMQTSNPGSKSRMIMNIFTCIGCFIGVSIVLFLWSFARNIPLLIIPVLIFAGSVMIKLAYEGIEYFEHAKIIPTFLRTITVNLLRFLYYPTRFLTFWIPDLGSPKVIKMNGLELAKWSLFLPFIIGLDDLLGYMGAMTIYNVFGLLIGIYVADIFIDILIFVSPKFTTKLVESPLLSIVAAFAFIYLGWKSFSEAGIMAHEFFTVAYLWEVILLVAVFALTVAVDLIVFKKSHKELLT
jgi:hypothetical protein